MADDKNAIEVLKALARLDLHGWRGLSQHTLLDHARQVFDIDDEWCGSSMLGTDRRQTYWFTVTCDGFPEGLRIWTSGNEVILLDASSPDLPGGLDALLTALGSPQAQLDSYLGTLRIENSEWVFPERGITVFVNPDNHLLLRIAVYRPSKLSEYEQSLRLDLKKTRLPPLMHSIEKESP